MRRLLLASFGFLVVLIGCGEVAPVGIDATPSCSPACDTNATCTGDTCACDTGWEGDGLTCTDANECMTNNGGCDPNAACFNTDGSRNCGCNTGYVGNGLTCRRVWEPRGNTQIRLSNVVNGQTNDAVATAVGTRIFFAPEIGSPTDGSQQFMRSFDTQTMTFNTGGNLAVPPAGTSDFCTCGYGQVFVSAGTDSIYMFGSHGYRYSVLGNSWTAVSGYTQLNSRGEAAGAFESNNGTVYMIGGRGALNTAFRYNTAVGGGFTTEPGTLPFGVEDARAWAPAGNNIVYVAGGFASDNSRQHFLSHSTGTANWTSLPDAPIQLSSLTGMGDWQGKIWVTTRSQMLFFDLVANTWRQPISLPGGFVAAVTIGSRTFSLVQINDQLEVQELMAIE